MAKQLDRKRPFGQIYGDMEGRAFEQDGIYFGPDEKEWVDPNAPAATDALANKAKPKKGAAVQAITPNASQVDAQLSGE